MTTAARFSERWDSRALVELGDCRRPRPIRVAHVTTIDLTLQVMLLHQLRRLRDEGFEVTAISAPGPAADHLEAEGIRHVAWTSITRAWGLRADARAFRELVGILRRGRFDLVHAHNPKPGVMVRVAARMLGVTCVVNTVHGLWVMPGDPAVKRLPVLAIERLCARLSDLELYQSEEDLLWARRIGLVPPGKSHLLGNGTDLSVFSPARVPATRRADLRRELGLSAESLVVGTIGRLVAEKGYREFFEAARRLRRKFPDVEFLAVGLPDPAKADAIPEAELQQARADVVLTGWRDDIPDLLAVMDLFVLASWREGLPRSAIEAAAMGKPLVLTDIRGCREVVRHGVEGLLVPSRDAGSLAQAIGSLIADPARRSAFGSAARARAQERFDGRRVEDILLWQYQRLLERAGLVERAQVSPTPLTGGLFDGR